MMETAVITWEDILAEEKQKPYFKAILDQLNQAYAQGKTIYPAKKDIFNAFTLTSYNNLKVVIIGQDPYHGPNQAHGLCFSVQQGVPTPPSLQNIYKELKQDLDFTIPDHGNLSYWAEQGVLLLNATLTVEAGLAGSHAKFGWQTFTDRVIELLNQYPEPLVYLLWGSHAQKKGQIIDTKKHHILTCAHPSPLSAHRGFMGCKHFSKANELLKKSQRTPIDWQIN